MTRDRHKSLVYAAEDMVFQETLFSETLGMRGATKLSMMLMEDPWWLANGSAFSVVATRLEAGHSFMAARSNEFTIRLCLGGETAATIAHEAAHILAVLNGETESHGPVFRAADVDVTAVVCGTIAADDLRAKFIGNNLPVATRTWAEPDALSDRGLYGRFRLAQFTSPTR